ncbi:pseudouridine synthase, partial [Schizopora paradoxa]
KKDRSRKAPQYDKRRGTRKEADDADADGEGVEKTPRLPKRLHALLIGYAGSGFNGMQIQPDVRTIEGEIFKALVNAGAVSKDNADDPVKVGLQRAARTDAGVHAAGNVVSIKMITAVPGVPDLLSRINDELPPEIRVWDYVRVQNSFNARTRKYTYFFPTYLLIPPKPGSGLHRTLKQSSSTSGDDHPFWKDVAPDSSREEDMQRKKKWRVGPDQLELLRNAARKYEGTHNFHNFTVGREPKDRSCQRHMWSIEISDPVVYGDTEWLSVLLHGQSFMLHQRKMISALVLSIRTGTPSSLIDELYQLRTVMIPKMPSLGLLLEHPIFSSYNARMQEVNVNVELTDPDYRPALDFDVHAEKIKAFKEEYIYSRMRSSEERVQVFDRWICSLDRYAGPDLLYLNPQGSIPDAAVVKKGKKRTNAFREWKKFDATDFVSADGTTHPLPEDDEVDEEEETTEIISKKDLEEAEG